MGKVCIKDPYRMSKMCVDDKDVSIFLLKKGQRELDKIKKRYLKRVDDPFDREKMEQLNPSMQRFTLPLSHIKSALCVTSEKNDRLYILKSEKAILNDINQPPIIPIELKKNGCKKINNSVLVNVISPKDVFGNSVKKTFKNVGKNIF